MQTELDAISQGLLRLAGQLTRKPRSCAPWPPDWRRWRDFAARRLPHWILRPRWIVSP